MHHFTAHRLRFVTEVQSTIEMNEHQGSAIRGALFHALRNRFCGNREAEECAFCPLVATCPVAFLVSTLKPESDRGRDIPRPFTVQPPLPGQGGHAVETDDGRSFFRYEPGETLLFGLTLYARALELFPYIVLAVQEFERGGLGRRVQQANGRWARGRLAVRQVWAENPLTGEQQSVMTIGDRLVQMPDVPITHPQVLQVEAPASRLCLHLLTPTRIVERAHLLKPEHFRFQPFFQRLMERLEALSRHFSDTPLLFEEPRALIQAAAQVHVVENRLSWEELRSYSTRRRAESPTSGLIGHVILATDDWSPFWPWLVWGQFVHVGKDAVKGNGWYRLETKGCPLSRT
jgi:hypothetical protein